METSLVVIKGRSPLTKQFCNFFVPRRRPSALFVLLTVADDVDLEGVRADLAAVVLGPVGLLAQVQLRHDGRTDRRGRHRKAARSRRPRSASQPQPRSLLRIFDNFTVIHQRRRRRPTGFAPSSPPPPPAFQSWKMRRALSSCGIL